MNSFFPRALIFDWDNTLVDSWGAIAEAINATRAAFELPAWSMAEIKARCIRSARESFPEWFGAAWERAYKIYYDNFDEVRKKRDLVPLPGASELLRWLHEQSIPAFIVSNKRGDYLRHEAERLNWTRYFAAIAGAQDAPRDKPAREHVDYALEKAGLRPDNAVWFVGDSEADILCARNADCTPVLIGSAEAAVRLAPAHMFSDCQDLQRLLYDRYRAHGKE